MFEYDNVYDDIQGKKAEAVKAKSKPADRKVGVSNSQGLGGCVGGSKNIRGMTMCLMICRARKLKLPKPKLSLWIVK